MLYPIKSCRKFLFLPIIGALSWGCATEPKIGERVQPAVDFSYSHIQPQVISLSFSLSDTYAGGLITADVDDDGQKDFIVTAPDSIAAYDQSGKEIWTQQIDIQLTEHAESHGLPGLHGAGVQAADIDGDQTMEVLFLTQNGAVNILNGANGEVENSIKLESPDGAEGWEHLVVANFRGEGDRDLLLQATNADGYRMGRYLAAYSLDRLRVQDNPQPLWTRDDFVANAHNGARVADLNQDGRDEVLGGTIISADGEILFQIPLKGHLDSLFVADVRPDIQGLELVALEEGGQNQDLLPGKNLIVRLVNKIFRPFLSRRNRIFLYNHDGLIWQANYRLQEPQNAAVGDFDLDRPGLEIWCRSRYNENQKPFVFDAQGKLITHYDMNDVSPKGWTEKGVEVIFTIDWTGGVKQLAAAKERAQSGDIAIFDPITGQFLYRFKESADRLYIADVKGDWREELVVLNNQELHIYRHPEPNPNPDLPSLWEQNHYQRSKMTWNYYSP